VVQSIQQVFLIDDDEAVRVAMCRLFESAGLEHSSYSSGDQFLQCFTPELTGCLVLDIRMSGISGMEVQRKLNDAESILPIIFMTGHGDLPMAVRAMRLGALHFLRKPVDETELLDSIQQAFEQESKVRQRLSQQRDAANRFNALTDRERQTVELVTDGSSNKSIASDLGISERTVEVHRSSAMKKLGVRTLAQLVRLRIDADHLSTAAGIK
jgi:FixJ family two-component response regulator